jgi:hypothetical protein
VVSVVVVPVAAESQAVYRSRMAGMAVAAVAAAVGPVALVAVALGDARGLSA